MDNEHSGSMSSGSGAVTSAPADIAAEKIGLSARAGAALSKVSETAQQAGSHVKEAATSLATEAGEEAKGVHRPAGRFGSRLLRIHRPFGESGGGYA
jgi:hypothetical protein